MTGCCLSTVGACSGCSPEEVPVTITNNIVEIGESTLLSYSGNVSLSSSTTLQLPYVPLSAVPIFLSLGGFSQTQNVDFVVSGTGLVTLTTATTETSARVSFSYLSDDAGISAVTSGSIIKIPGVITLSSQVPTGYIILDGGALQGEGAGLGYVITGAYAAAFAQIGYSLGGSAGYFCTNVVQETLYSGGSLVVLNAFLKL